MMIFKTWIQNHKTTVILYISMGIAIALLQALGVCAFQCLLDQFAQQSVVVSDVLLYGACIAAVCILNYIDNIPDAQLSNGVYLDLKLMALKKMSGINYTDYQHIGMGKLIQQIENGACAGKSILVDFYFRLFRELLPDMIISIIFIVCMNKNLVWFIFVGYVFVFIVLYVQYKLDKVTFQRYDRILFLPEDKALYEGEKIDIDSGEIQFRNVSFFYEQKPILKNISFTIPPNRSIAFVGESGAGKSTIIKLLMGLIKPCAGAVFIDGNNLSDMVLNHFYDYVSYTAQDSPIFNGTLYENIVFDQHVKEADILEVLRLVQLDRFCLGLEKGLFTEVGEKGVLLSGGERQRLALARIFFQKAKIVILDEATSAMDNITEALVMHNLREAFKDRTLIMVAHRLSSIQDVDHIVVLKNGCVIEEGRFKELLEMEGYFKALWNK